MRPLGVKTPAQKQNSLSREARGLGRRSSGPWRYVGAVGAPAYVAPWANAGGGLPEVRYRWSLAGGLDVEGVPDGGTDSDLVFTLEPVFAPDAKLRIPSISSGTVISYWLVNTDGTVYYKSVSASGSGIRFDFDNETVGVGATGGVLSTLLTTNVGDGSGGYAFIVKNENNGGVGNPQTEQFLFSAITQGFQILQTGGTTPPTGGLDVDVIGAINLISETRAVVILANGNNVNGLVDIEAYTNINLYCSNGPVQIQGEDVIITWAGATKKLQVLDHLNAAIFEVHDDGSLHGKTGQALTFDL